ncbi:MAG TPA: hypothetical protein DD723_06510 [Candidatus Omnitrophica bacterium]|nr:MAG: hypothetical protein A2Z81_07580 [Omnitrophica WOR_2 bacterium GWA2_45_18]HBR15175.1 hypothetical protein [Candidatus Omnitrophota bacterium]
MFKESETIEFKKSTAQVKAGVLSPVAMLNKHGRGEEINPGDFFIGHKKSMKLDSFKYARNAIRQITH